MGSYGTSARTLFEYNAHVPRLASAYLDSPQLPDTGVGENAVSGFDQALETFFAG